MSEYVKRAAGGFYIIDEPRHGSKLVIVRRAVHQVIDPKTDHPYPELPAEERYLDRYLEDTLKTRELWKQQYECNFTNSVAPEAELTEDDLVRTLEIFRRAPVRWQ